MYYLVEKMNEEGDGRPFLVRFRSHTVRIWVCRRGKQHGYSATRSAGRPYYGVIGERSPAGQSGFEACAQRRAGPLNHDRSRRSVVCTEACALRQVPVELLLLLRLHYAVFYLGISPSYPPCPCYSEAAMTTDARRGEAGGASRRESQCGCKWLPKATGFK